MIQNSVNNTKAHIASSNEGKHDISAVSSDPFDTPFDDESDDEWWNDEISADRVQDTIRSLPLEEKSITTQRSGVMTSSKRSQSSRQQPPRPYSVRKPVREKSKQRQKKQNVKAGIRLVTDLPPREQRRLPEQGPQSSLNISKDTLQRGAFVDLAALQALDSQNTTSSRGLWNTVLGRHVEDDEPKHGIPGQKGRENPRKDRLVPSPLNLGDDLSPNDRPIVIGLSIPSAKLSEHIISPDTAKPRDVGSDAHTAGTSLVAAAPETPTIRITPEQKVSTWLSLNNNSPEYRKTTRNSDITVFSEDDDLSRPTPRIRPRIKSSDTIFEEDQDPILQTSRSRADSSASIINRNGIIVDSTDRRESRGWWNHILTPFLSRSNTLGSPQSPEGERPALPDLEAAIIQAQQSGHAKAWEKQLSPLTPETSTTIASDAWWESRNTIDCTPKPPLQGGENANGHKHRVQESSGTLPFMLSAGDLETSMAHDPYHKKYRDESAPQVIKNHATKGLQRLESTKSRLSSVAGPSPSDRLAPFVLVQSNSRRLNPAATLSARDITSSNVVYVSRPSNNTSRSETISDRLPAVPQPVIYTDSPQPPPYSPPRRNVPKYRVIYPPGYANALSEPSSPGPLSPGLQHTMASRGAIALTDVPSTPPQPPPLSRKPINLNSSYSRNPTPRKPVFVTHAYMERDSEKPRQKSRKLEDRRRRYEREDALAHKAGGLWRGRGCVPDRGCYGRGGAEGRKRRRCWFGLIAGFLSMIILTIVLATQLHHSQSTVMDQSQWLNLTGFPPIFTGVSTIADPENTKSNTGCVFPATLWSCSLPKELQSSAAPNPSNQPNFRIQIQWDNSSETNATFANLIGQNRTTSKKARRSRVAVISHFVRGISLRVRQTRTFSPSPTAPSIAEQFFLGNTTDGIVSNNKSGEPTPFYITFLSATGVLDDPAQLLKRQSNGSDPFPNVTSFIPPPSSNSDGTAAPANLLPLPVQQPIRLYDRGLPTEHYGFYNYFDRSIFLKSTAVLNASNTDDGEVPDDENGGSTESEALTRCTWAQTRFLVQMWTARGSSSRLLNNTGSGSSTSTLNQTANDFLQPGSFPYPVTITTDRHGGDPSLKMIYCYSLDNREHLIASSAQVHLENRAFGGTIINPAPSVFVNTSTPSLGGFDGGNSGCSCQWANWQTVVNT